LIITKHKGGSLWLAGLTSLSAAAAQALAKHQHKGSLVLQDKVESKVDRYRS